MEISYYVKCFEKSKVRSKDRSRITESVCKGIKPFWSVLDEQNLKDPDFNELNFNNWINYEADYARNFKVSLK